MGRGRTGERERFTRDFLKHFGAEVEGERASRGRFRATLTPGLRRRLRVRELECVFRAEELDDRPEAELMVPGNPVFDRMLATARRLGGVSRRYQRARRALLQDRAARAALGEAARQATIELGKPCYRSSVLLTFRVNYRSFESFDEIHAIMLSGLTGRYHQSDNFFRGLNLAETVEEGIEDGDRPDVIRVLVGALAELELRIAASVERFVTRSEAQLARESERLKGFYTELIGEEKIRRARRRIKASSVEAAERKLEWVQRLDRENRLFAPEVAVNLIGLEEIRVPVRPVTVRLGGGGLVEADLDLAGGELAALQCSTCEVDLGELRLCSGEHPVCAECLEVCAECAPA